MHKTIYTLRHSATDAARSRIILGHLDQEINAEGQALIRKFLERHGRVDADQVISSPLKRTMTTAIHISGKTKKQINISPLCIERNYGKLQGIPPNRLQTIEPATFYVEAGGIMHSLNPPGGETLEDVRRRAALFFDFLLGVDGTALVVSHHCFLTQLHGLLRGEDVYNCLMTDIGILDLNRFDLAGSRLVNESREYSIENSAYRSW